MSQGIFMQFLKATKPTFHNMAKRKRTKQFTPKVLGWFDYIAVYSYGLANGTPEQKEEAKKALFALGKKLDAANFKG
jgi:hypothetical protein